MALSGSESKGDLEEEGPPGGLFSPPGRSLFEVSEALRVLFRLVGGLGYGNDHGGDGLVWCWKPVFNAKNAYVNIVVVATRRAPGTRSLLN